MWPSQKATPGQKTNHRATSQQQSESYIECTFEFDHRISIQRSPTIARSLALECHLEYQFLTFDSRLKRKSLERDGFHCISDDPENFNIAIKKNSSQWLKSSLKLRKRFKAEVVTSGFENTRPSNAFEKQRRHATTISSLNESVCVSDELHKVIFENLSDDFDVTVLRRLEMEDSVEVCSTVVEMPFGYHAVVNISVIYFGKFLK